MQGFAQFNLDLGEARLSKDLCELTPWYRFSPHSLSSNALRLTWEEQLRRRAYFHDVRHQATSRFFEMGLTTPELASISDRGIRMLMRYAHPMRQRIIEQIDTAGTKNLEPS